MLSDDGDSEVCLIPVVGLWCESNQSDAIVMFLNAVIVWDETP